jgi:hypothetical protein
MSSNIQIILFLVLGSIPTARALTALKRCTKLSDDFAHQWRQEYETRLCGEILANTANLSEAADLIGDLNSNLSVMAKIAAETLTDQLISIYPSSLLLDPETCQTTETATIAAVLHKEHHPGQPKHWPNWRTRIIDLQSEALDAAR